MVVPVILNYNIKNFDSTDGMWIFYKYLDFALKNNSCIIGREIYFEDPKKYEDNWNLKKSTREMYDYPYPDIDFLEYNKKFMISNAVEKKLEKSKITWADLLTKDNILLSNELEKIFDKIEKETGNKIDIIVSWYPFYTLTSICKKRNIKFLYTELTTIRKEWYNYNLGVISSYGKYNAKYDYSLINEFNKKNNQLFLTREELIILFSYKEDVVKYLKILKSNPIYEVGYALGLDKDPYELAFSSVQQSEIISKLLDNYKKDELLFRTHPQGKTELPKDLNIDDSKSSREFIEKCNKIVVNISNVGYEAMLYGKKVTHLNENFLSSFGEKDSLNLLNDSVTDLIKLNFLTFYLYTPFSKMFDSKYIYDFCNNKYDVDTIYEMNLKTVLFDNNINYNKFKKMSLKDRKKYILEKVHSFSNEEIEFILNISYNLSEFTKNEKLEKINNDLETKINKIVLEKKEEINYKNQEISKLEDTLNLIYNSNSWKSTKFLRSISAFIKRFKNIKGAKNNEE